MSVENFFSFDLQRFSEGGESPAGGGQNPIDGAPAGSVQEQEGEPPAGGEKSLDTAPKDGTLIGGAGKEGAPTAVPETYDLSESLPEGAEIDQAQFEVFSSIAKECGLNNEQANKMAKYGFEYVKANLEAAQAAHLSEIQSWGMKTKQKLGADFNKTIEKVGVAMEALEKQIPGIRQALNETGAGNRIELVRAFALLGEIVGEDSFRGFGEQTPSGSIYSNTNFKQYE